MPTVPSRYRLLYVTASDEKEAEAIAAALVEERLAACANVHPVRSVYRWKGKVEHAAEAALVLKTRAALVPAAMARIRALHSYEVPCIVSLPIEGGSEPFLRWLDESTAPG